MHFDYLKPVDVDNFKTKITKQIKNIKFSIFVSDVILSVLPKFDGKKMTKRFETAVNKELKLRGGDDYYVRLVKPDGFGGWKLLVSKMSSVLRDTTYLRINSERSDVVDIDFFKKEMAGIYDTYKIYLKNSEQALINAEEIVNNWNNAVEKLQDEYYKASNSGYLYALREV